MATIGDVTTALEKSLPGTLQPHLRQILGYSLNIEIRENDRKKRSNASLESWRPANGEIVIRFGDPASMILDPEASPRSSPEGGQTVVQPGDLSALPLQVELIRALWDAEHRPGFEFVGLKWFRDTFLPAQGHRWSQESLDKDRLIRDAVDDRIFLTRKVPNPKSPEYPVTAIRLNHQHPEVVEVLRGATAEASAFEPVDIKGEPLSDTVSRERR